MAPKMAPWPVCVCAPCVLEEGSFIKTRVYGNDNLPDEGGKERVARAGQGGWRGLTETGAF